MRTFTFIFFLLLTSCCESLLTERTPVKWEVDLVEREKEFDLEMKKHLLPEGLLIYRTEDYNLVTLYEKGTCQADGAYMTGLLLGALVCKYQVTKDPEVLALAQKVCDGMFLLVTGSGYPGLVARSYGKKDFSSDSLLYRRDGSGDQMTGWLFGINLYTLLIDDPARKEKAAVLVKQIAQHMKKHNLKVYMGEDEPTPHGNFWTPVGGIVPVAHYAVAMMGLASLSVRLNPEDEFCAEFMNWLIGMDYPRQAKYFYSWFPQTTTNTANYILALMTTWSNDESPHRRDFYKSGADSMWKCCHEWQLSLFALVYKYIGGDCHSSDIEDSIDRLRNLPPYHRTLVEEKSKDHLLAVVPFESRTASSCYWNHTVHKEIPSQLGERQKTVVSRQDFLLAYWFGRWMGEYSK